MNPKNWAVPLLVLVVTIWARGLSSEVRDLANSSYGGRINSTTGVQAQRPEKRAPDAPDGARLAAVLPTDEFLLDTTRLMQLAPGRQDNALAAFDGTNYLALWIDTREGRDAVFGARIRPDGTIIDQGGLRVLEGFNHSTLPSAVAYGNGCFLTEGVVLHHGWMDQLWWLDCARVMPDGTAPDIPGFIVSEPAYDQILSPAIVLADSGSAFLVTWVCSGAIQGAFVYPDGTHSSAFSIVQPAGMLAYSIACCHDTFLVAYQRDVSGTNDVMGIRLGSNGLPMDSVPFVISSAPGGQSSPSVAYDGSNFIVAWQDYRREPGCPDLYACRVTTGANVLDTSGICISASGQDSNPSVSAMAGLSLVTWRHAGDNLPMAARLTSSGALLDTTPIRVCCRPTSQTTVRSAAGNSNFMVVWSDASGDSGEVYCNIIDTSGVVIDTAGILVTMSANRQSHPAVGGGQFGYFAAWQDDAQGNIYGTRVSSAGTVLDVPALTVSAATGEQSCPAVTAMDFGTGYLTVWQDARNGTPAIDGARVSTMSGQVLDPQGIAISPPGDSGLTPAVAWNGTNALVVWRNGSGVYGCRFAPSGEVLDTNAIVIHTGSSLSEPPAVASDGNEFLVAWSNGDIYGTRVASEGNVLDSAIPLVGGNNDQCQASLAFGVRSFGLVEMDWRYMYLEAHGYHFAPGAVFARVEMSGSRLDSIVPLEVDDHNRQASAIAWNGEYFATAWATNQNRGYEYDLSGYWVDTSGNVAENLPPITHDDGDQFTPALAHGLGPQVLLIYSGLASTVDGKSYGTSRIWGKLIELTGISEDRRTSLQPSLSRVNAGPVPARDRVVVHYELTRPQRLTLSVFDCSGRLIHRESRLGPAGNGAFIWRGVSDKNRAAPNAAYPYVLRDASGETATGRIVLLK